MAMTTGYSRTQIVLHWVTVFLVAGQYLFSDGIGEAWRDGIRSGSMTFTPPALLHMGSGLAILLVVLYRLFLRSSEGVPPPPDGEPGWAALAARVTHVAFYAGLFLLPVSGAVAWAQGSRGAGEVHEALTTLLLVLIVAHVGAVLVHQFVWKTGLLSRMTRPS